MRATLERWIPIILAAQMPDGYLQTAYILADRKDVARALVARSSRQSRRLCLRLLHRIGHQPLHADRRQGSAPLQRRQEAGRLLGCQHRSRQEGLVRRAPGDGAGAGALRPLRQRSGRQPSRRRVHRARQVPARFAPRRLGVRPEPPAARPAIRGGGPRRARHVLLLGHGGYRRRDPRPRLPERRDVALGQHGQQEVLPDRRHRQRRNLGRLRAELLAAQRGLLRDLLELRTCLLPVQAEPRLPRREVRRPVRADDVQRAARRRRPGRQELLLHQSAGQHRARQVARLPVLRRQHPAHAADDSDLDLCQRATTGST